MKSVRIGAGLGFYGDSWLPIRATLERGDVKYIASDHLSELTLAILRKDLAKDPSAGYTRDLVPMLTALWPLAAPRGVRFVLNAGGLNPRGAGAALTAAFRAKGWRARIAVVTGDDVLDQIDALRAGGDTLRHMDTGVEIDTVRERLVFANAYLGAGPITQALAAGADIVLTGRVADAALALGPIVHELGWPLAARTQQEWDRLALGLTVGHLLECSGQGSGGNFGSAGAWNEIPDLGHIGYPIAEVREAVKAALLQFLAPLDPTRVGTLEDQATPLNTPQYADVRKGWPLRKPVTDRELLAVASRVSGVLFVNDVKIAEGTKPSVAQIPMNGLELPRVAGVSVVIGDPLDLDQLRGQGAGAGTGGTGAPPTLVPVPVVPEEC